MQPEKPDYQDIMDRQHRAADNMDMDEDFRPIYHLCREYTMTSIERMFDLYKSVQYISRANIPGALVECGVWRGGSAMVVAQTLAQEHDHDRMIVLYDTFEGHVSEPDSELDVGIFGDSGFNDFHKNTDRTGVGNWCAASVDEVIANIAKTDFRGNVTPVRGQVEKTLDPHEGYPISLLRLDMDWYKPTVRALESLEPWLSYGGVLIADDYGHYFGQRKAVDEYFARKGIPILFHRIDYACRSGIKFS